MLSLHAPWCSGGEFLQKLAHWLAQECMHLISIYAMRVQLNAPRSQGFGGSLLLLPI
jgi:hypothetical protein